MSSIEFACMTVLIFMQYVSYKYIIYSNSKLTLSSIFVPART